MQGTNNQNIEETNEIDLIELFFALLSHWKAIACVSILVAVAAFCVSVYLMTPVYESASALYVVSKNSESTSLSDLQVGSNLTNDYMNVIVGRRVLEMVIDNLDLDEEYEGLHSRVQLKNPTSSRIISITVSDTDPVRAKQTADEIATVASTFITDMMKQEPPSIIEYGAVADEPVSPSVMKNTVIGFALGFMISAAVVILRSLLNNKIMTPEDVEKKLGMNVLASLPIDSAEYDGKKKAKGRK